MDRSRGSTENLHLYIAAQVPRLHKKRIVEVDFHFYIAAQVPRLRKKCIVEVDLHEMEQERERERKRPMQSAICSSSFTGIWKNNRKLSLIHI